MIFFLFFSPFLSPNQNFAHKTIYFITIISICYKKSVVILFRGDLDARSTLSIPIPSKSLCLFQFLLPFTFSMTSPDIPKKSDNGNPIYRLAPIDPRALIFFLFLFIFEYNMSSLFFPLRESQINLMLSMAISLLHEMHSDRGILIPPRTFFFAG